MIDPENTPEHESKPLSDKGFNTSREITPTELSLGFAETEQDELASRWCYLLTALPPSLLYTYSNIPTPDTRKQIERLIQTQEAELHFNDDKGVPLTFGDNRDQLTPGLNSLARAAYAQELSASKINELLLADPNIQDLNKFALKLWQSIDNKSNPNTTRAIKRVLEGYAQEAAHHQESLGNVFIIEDLAPIISEQLSGLYAVYGLNEGSAKIEEY